MMPYLRPHLYAPRQLGYGHKIHESVYDLKDYNFKARLFKGHEWEEESELYDLIEPDLKKIAREVVRMLKDPLSTAFDVEFLDLMSEFGT